MNVQPKWVRELKPGLYKIYWKEGGSSLAAVGLDFSGRRWLAPTNWISVPAFNVWPMVEKVELLEPRHTHGAEPREPGDDMWKTNGDQVKGAK